tara:strand:- start:119 stop:1426 length:1308 start_codon:yes stop_codon:yes gene_type:complete
MKKITFCINTAKNEKDYINLLLTSMEKHFDSLEHEVIIFIDSDNQNTYEFLTERDNKFKDMRILRNKLPVPIGYAPNINLMFEEAKNDIVSFIQSDMVVGKHYDTEILRHLKDDNTIVSATRVEPSLHPPSNEKMTQDFGLSPDEFNWDAFNKFVKLYSDTKKVTHYWFAPFTMYKKQWLDIGGHDTLFRRSREDTDILMRFRLKGLNIIQTWSAVVYHFTCVSSRGKNWFKEEGQERAKLQSVADTLEVSKLYRKWRRFDHSAEPVESQDNCYLYRCSLALRNCDESRQSDIFQLSQFFDTIYIDDEVTLKSIHKQFETAEHPANALFGYTQENWDEYSKYFNTPDYKSIFQGFNSGGDDDIILSFDISEITQERFDFITKFNDIVHHQTEVGNEYEFDIFKVKVNKKVNTINDNIVVSNPPLKLEEIVEEYNG